LRDYELMWILPGTATEEEGNESIKRIRALVSERSGEVKSAEHWARRTLSYPIQNNREGHYFLCKFSLDSERANEVDRAVTSDQSIIRHLLTIDEPVKHKNSRKAKAASK
jgi:small subunit ribosomal protein S6